MRTPDEHAVAAAIIQLMNEVVYRDARAHVATWETLQRHRAAVADHFSQIGVEVIVDDAEGYAYLRTREPDHGETPLPRLVRRRSLTYNVSLLLVLLRKRMVEFEAAGGEGKLVLTRDHIIEMLRTFQSTSSNEARIVDQADRTIGQVADLGFLRALPAEKGSWEVRRILKAYIDAQTLSDFNLRLETYAGGGTAPPDGSPADVATTESVDAGNLHE